LRLRSTSGFNDKIIGAAGPVRAAFFVQRPDRLQENLLGGENFCEKPESMFASLNDAFCDAP
jgi:hypothetical protein